MRVVINQSTTLGHKAGIGHYTAQLVQHLCAQAGSHQIDTFPTGWVRTACEAYMRTRSSLYTGRDNRQPKERRPGLLPRLRQAALKHLYSAGQDLVGRQFHARCARGAYDLYHEPNSIPLPCDRPTVATLHDLSLLLHPEWHTAERVAYFTRNLPRALSQCVHFLTDSDFVRRQVIEVLNVPAERVTRVYLGIRAELQPLSAEATAEVRHRLGLPPRYLLYVGTIEPRKNLLPVLTAYCSLPDDLRARWPLLLVGKWGWNAQAVTQYFHRTARHRGVLHLGYLADADLPAVYNGARALVYPSLYEGFGLPPLEMMACGGAVLASTAEVLTETIGGQAHLVHPEDVDAWRDGLARVLRDDEWWQSLRAGTAEVARTFTWQRCAAETLDVYRSLCGEAVEKRKAG